MVDATPEDAAVVIYSSRVTFTQKVELWLCYYSLPHEIFPPVRQTTIEPEYIDGKHTGFYTLEDHGDLQESQ